jgi:hypothetical protein
VSVVWHGKRPTRLPEALWLSFQPAPAAIDQTSWRLHKLGSLISPMEVSFCMTERPVTRGSSHHLQMA